MSMETEHTLWNPLKPAPAAPEIPLLKNVDFHVIKKHEPDVDGYNFLHGVALAWHKAELWASFGRNKSRENTAGEEARGRKSEDAGKNWSVLFTIDPGKDNLSVSSGVFLARDDELWAFQGAFYDYCQQVHTRAYLLTKDGETWENKGVVIDRGFWPMQEPQKMDNGSYIMAGACVAAIDPPSALPAVAVSRGDNLIKWDLAVIPIDKSVSGLVWGESTAIVHGGRIINIARWGKPVALVSTSDDYGRTWTPARPGNLPMTASKPYAGTLSTGRHYLIGTTASDCGNRRYPLTIAVSRPNETFFSNIFRIRDDVLPSGGACESVEEAALSYPYAVEHKGKLYVGYSNNGGRRGQNLNSAELAVIPISEFSN